MLAAMTLNRVCSSQESTWDILQIRIERLNGEKTRLLDEWGQAMKRAYHVPPPYRQDVLQVVGKKYSTLVDAVESHITVLKASRGEFPPRIERLLPRTGWREIR